MPVEQQNNHTHHDHVENITRWLSKRDKNLLSGVLFGFRLFFPKILYCYALFDPQVHILLYTAHEGPKEHNLL